MTEDTYIALCGQYCPECGSTNVTVDGEITPEFMAMWHRRVCLSCDTEWDDIYELRKIMIQKIKGR